MATGGVPTWKEEDFRHTCSLCMEPYRGRSPKILPCFHTFCLPCLTALQDSVTTATPERRLEEKNRSTEDEEQKQPDSNSDEEKKQDKKSEGDDVTNERIDDVEKSVLLCPTCRAPVSIPEGGVAALQTYSYLDHETGADEAPPPVLCDMCDEGNRQHAAHACQQCQLRMCLTCRHYHDKLMRDHHVTAVSLRHPEERGEMEGLCPVHHGQVICFHCRQCDVSICLHCKLTSHEGHVTVDLARAALEAKEEVTSLVATVQQQLQVVESSLRSMERDERELTCQKEEVTRQVNARYDALMTWARRSRDLLLEEVSAKEHSQRSQLRAEKTAATVSLETLSALVSRAARVTGKDPGLVSLKNELRAALLSEDRLDHHRQQAERQEPVWGWRYDVTEASVLQLEVVQAYMGRVVEGDRADVTLPRSLRKLSDKVDRLMNEMAETNTNIIANTTNIYNIISQLMLCKEDLLTLKKNGADLQTSTSSFVANITDLQTKASSLTGRLTSVQMVVDDLKSTLSLEDEPKKAGGSVVFFAEGIDTAKTKQCNRIVFTSVKVNEESCYSNTTGVFTTTVAGIYVFAASVMSAKKDISVTARIKVDDTDYTVLRGSYTSSASGNLSVQLEPGQTVWVEAWNDAGDYWSAGICFTGALVQPQL